MTTKAIDDRKLTGTSTEKTALESSLGVDNAGLEFTIAGGDTYIWNGSAFNFKQKSTDGAVHVTDPAVGALETREFTLTGGTPPAGDVRLDFGSERVKGVIIECQKAGGTAISTVYWTPGNPPNNAAGEAALTEPASSTEAGQRKKIPIESPVGSKASDKLTWKDPVQYIHFCLDGAGTETVDVAVHAILEA